MGAVEPAVVERCGDGIGLGAASATSRLNSAGYQGKRHTGD
jgi:hypothetical protein